MATKVKKKNKPGQGRKVVDWPKEKVAQLKKLYPTGDNKEVAAKLGITVSALRNASIRFKVKKSTRYWDKPWEDLVIKQWPAMSPEEIAAELLKKFKVVKTKWSVINKYRELAGLR